ncbi:alkaline phosphatase family protein [Candidatus Dependentiae bacterium]
MMSYIKKSFFVAFFVLLSHITLCDIVLPRLTVIFIVDQLSFPLLNKMKEKLHGGLKLLLQKGVSYENAYYPHAKPATSTGHVALNTGVFAKDHGVVSNKWFNKKGKKIYFPDSGDDKSAAVFASDGKKTLSYSRSAKRLMVPGISDTFVLNPQGLEKNYAYAISLKDRAAIGNASKLGKGIWFDTRTGYFTSSKAYFDKLPDWVNNFNKEKKIYELRSVKWEPAYGLGSSYYKFKDAFNYTFASAKQIIGKQVSIYSPQDKRHYNNLKLTPYANDLVCDLAEKCVEHIMYGNKKNRLVLWVSLSSLDKLGHIFGPCSAEVLDVVYHIDRRIKKFIKNVQKKIKKSDILFAVTADHGVSPIPEILQKEGFKSAIRVDEKQLLAKANRLVKDIYGISNLFIGLMNNQLFVDTTLFDILKKSQKQKIRKTVKDFLIKHPGIKRVWTSGELKNKIFEPHDLGLFFKNQLYPGRSGEFIIQVAPYCQITDYKTGTCHSSPYEYDVHVPLIMYQKGSFEGKTVRDRVSMLRFANSLAEILQVPKSPVSTFNLLPGLFDKESVENANLIIN